MDNGALYVAIETYLNRRKIRPEIPPAYEMKRDVLLAYITQYNINMADLIRMYNQYLLARLKVISKGSYDHREREMDKIGRNMMD